MALSESRTQQVLSFLRVKVSLPDTVENLRSAYLAAKPFPHLVLDNFFPDEMLEGLLAEIPSHDSEKWIHFSNDRMVKSNLRSACDLSERGFRFLSEIHSSAFLFFLTELTGVRALLPDPYLTGAGYHAAPEGGKFDIHVDRNADHYTGLRRSCAMITYLNKGWKPEYGGQLELYNEDATRCEKVIDPLFNRVVIFPTAEKNYHAVRPVTAGSGAVRLSFICYYHVVDNNLVLHNSLFAPAAYREREPQWRAIGRELLPPAAQTHSQDKKPAVTIAHQPL